MAVATLRKLGELLPDDTWAVRVAVDSNMLLDDPDVAIYTPLLGRRGRDSTPEGAEPGMIAARFRHYESRDGQPLLHDHLVLSVKVRRTDGQWGTLHTRTLLEYTLLLVLAVTPVVEGDGFDVLPGYLQVSLALEELAGGGEVQGPSVGLAGTWFRFLVLAGGLESPCADRPRTAACGGAVTLAG